jgi:hypothetical protein
MSTQRELPKTRAGRTSRELFRCSYMDRIPSPLGFGLLVMSSLFLSSSLFNLASAITVGDLLFVGKHLEQWWQVGGLVAWRALELGLARILGFDGEFADLSLPLVTDTNSRDR